MSHPVASSLLSLAQLKLRLLLGVLLLNLLAIGLSVYSLYRDRQQYEQRTLVTTQNMARLLERDISAVFARIDYILDMAVSEVEKQMAAGVPDATRLNAFLLHQQAYMPEVISLRVADEKGVMRYGEGVAEAGAVDISDREHFLVPRNQPQAGLVIASPIKLRTDHVWAIPVARRLNKADGAFAGIVYVNLPVEYFVNMFSSLELGAHGLVALRNMDYQLIARYPVAEAGAIGEVAVSKELRALLMAGQAHGTYMAPAPTDRIERTYTFYRLTAHPLYVLAGLAPQDYLADWWKNVVETLILTLAFVLVSVILALLVWQSWRRQWAFSQALRENEQRWSLALESSNFSVWDWNLQTGEIEFSQAGTQMFGFSEDEIGNRMSDWEQRCHPDDRAQVVAAMKDHFRGRAVRLKIEFRVRCKDGNWKWIRAHGMVVQRDPEGKPLRMIGTHSDISEQRRREDELRLAGAVFQMADEGMMVTSPENQIMAINPAFTAITGYEAAEVLGRNPSFLSVKSHPKAFYQELWASLIATGSWAGEVLNRKKSGEVYVQWLSIKCVLDERGQLTNHVAVFSDITERKAAEKRMRHLALHDALTDLPNRALLSERLEQAILGAQRNRVHLAVLYFDLDKFKPVNDNFGHEVGDLLLKEVAGRVRGCIRASDTVARIGGDEFVVLLASVEGEREALMVAEKIRQALGQPFLLAGHTLEIAASIGVTLFPEHGNDEQTLIRHADAAMYHAKDSGRNQVVLFRLDM